MKDVFVSVGDTIRIIGSDVAAVVESAAAGKIILSDRDVAPLPGPEQKSVPTLLAESRAAHLQYRRRHADTNNTDDAEMTRAITVALETRQQAHDADPTHRDPAWQQDEAELMRVMKLPRPVASADLLSFYKHFLIG